MLIILQELVPLKFLVDIILLWNSSTSQFFSDLKKMLSSFSCMSLANLSVLEESSI